MWEAIVVHFVKGALYDVSNLYLALTTSKIRKGLTPNEVFVLVAKNKFEAWGSNAELGLQQALFLQRISPEVGNLKSLSSNLGNLTFQGSHMRCCEYARFGT